MPRKRILVPSLLLSAVALAFAAPPAGAQAPRPGQLTPGPGQQPGSGQQPRGPAQAAPQPAPPKPYKVIAVTLPQPYSDPSFAAFRKQLGDIASKKDRAALAKMVANTFFWMGEKGDKANKKKAAIDNLAAAIDLDDKDGSGWMAIAAAAEESTLEPIPDRKGIMCSPAGPTFDEAAAEAVAKDSGTEPSDWAYPVKAGLEVHGAAQPNAPVIDKLGMNLVRVMAEPPAGAQQPPQSPFVRIVTPAGKVGYVLEENISALDQDQMCFAKDATGWKIAGYAGGD